MANAENYAAFLKVIDALDIKLSQSKDGVYTVCTTQEPLFCFDGDSREQLSELVVDTLVSYGKHFYGLDLPTVRTENRPFDQAPLPVERTIPLERIKPVFDLAA